MSTAQDLREAAKSNTGLDTLSGRVLAAFFEVNYDEEIQTEYDDDQNLRSSLFALLVAEALDYREPISFSEAFKIGDHKHGLALIRATKRHHGIG